MLGWKEALRVVLPSQFFRLGSANNLWSAELVPGRLLEIYLLFPKRERISRVAAAVAEELQPVSCSHRSEVYSPAGGKHCH